MSQNYLPSLIIGQIVFKFFAYEAFKQLNTKKANL